MNYTQAYNELEENKNIKSSNILCLFMNRYQNITWSKDMIFNTASEIRKSSYYGFIRRVSILRIILVNYVRLKEMAISES